jgi:hypothetical protein
MLHIDDVSYTYRYRYRWMSLPIRWESCNKPDCGRLPGARRPKRPPICRQAGLWLRTDHRDGLTRRGERRWTRGWRRSSVWPAPQTPEPKGKELGPAWSRARRERVGGKLLRSGSWERPLKSRCVWGSWRTLRLEPRKQGLRWRWRPPSGAARALSPGRAAPLRSARARGPWGPPGRGNGGRDPAREQDPGPPGTSWDPRVRCSSPNCGRNLRETGSLKPQNPPRSVLLNLRWGWLICSEPFLFPSFHSNPFYFFLAHPSNITSFLWFFSFWRGWKGCIWISFCGVNSCEGQWRLKLMFIKGFSANVYLENPNCLSSKYFRYSNNTPESYILMINYCKQPQNKIIKILGAIISKPVRWKCVTQPKIK